jgi:hypothetical protein
MPVLLRAWISENSPHHPERAAPTGLIEEMNYDMHQKSDALANFFLQILIGGSFK